MFSVKWLNGSVDEAYRYIQMPVNEKLNFIFSIFLPCIHQEYSVSKIPEQICGFTLRYKIFENERHGSRSKQAFSQEFSTDFYLDITDDEYKLLPEKEKTRLFQDSEICIRKYLYSQALDCLEKKFFPDYGEPVCYWLGFDVDVDVDRTFLSCDVGLEVLKNPSLLGEKEWALIRNCSRSFVLDDDDSSIVGFKNSVSSPSSEISDQFQKLFSSRGICHIDVHIENDF